MWVLRILPSSWGLKYRGPASAESAHKHGKGSYKMCEGLPAYFKIRISTPPAPPPSRRESA